VESRAFVAWSEHLFFASHIRPRRFTAPAWPWYTLSCTLPQTRAGERVRL
jgi:hypothetical protein